MLAGVFDFKSHKMAEDNIHNAYDKSARKHMFFDKIKGYILRFIKDSFNIIKNCVKLRSWLGQGHNMTGLSENILKRVEENMMIW